MKKLLQSVLIVSVSFGIFSCSKKVTTFNFGKPYHESNQLVKEVSSQPSAETISASISPEAIVPVKEKSVVKIEKPVTIASVENKTSEKPTFKEKMAKKMLVKKIEKLEKSNAISGNMKLGIIIAAISLVVLIVVAAGLLGGLSGLFWLLGGLGFLTGLVIILLAALDVI